LLADLPLQIVSQGSLGIPEAEEPHHTFVENALAKARHAARASGLAAIADDSGLCVNALGGSPGVISAHYAGELARLPDEEREALRRRQDAANNARLLAALQGQADRRAHFISTLVAVRHADDPEPLVAVGRWSGQILEAARGSQGFGYDPLMFIPALGQTVAELDADTKNLHSHRARSATALRAMLAEAWHVSA
jgi:XTP/dITP diphosphohydrolase